MSEEFYQLSDEAEGSGQSAEAGSAPREGTPGKAKLAREAQPGQQLSESIIPEQPVNAWPQYPPPPEFYASMPDHVNVPTGPLRPVQYMPPALPASDYGYPSQGLRYGLQPVSEARPLPVGQALRELPRQYKKILFRPGARSFLEEQGKAEWGIIWLQLLLQMLLAALLSIPEMLVYTQTHTTDQVPFFTNIYLLELVVLLVLAPAIFFAQVGIQYLLARAFKGIGSFKQQAYNQLLFSLPLGIISRLLSVVFTSLTRGSTLLAFYPNVSTSTAFASVNGAYLVGLLVFDVLAFALSIYGLVLNVFSLMAVHRMSSGRASAAVLLPLVILFLVVFIVAFAVAFSMLASHLPNG
ncbi:MAG TPA: Yip1 family protein [Ktedonobacteraceae bacterium]